MDAMHEIVLPDPSLDTDERVESPSPGIPSPPRHESVKLHFMPTYSTATYTEPAEVTARWATMEGVLYPGQSEPASKEKRVANRAVYYRLKDSGRFRPGESVIVHAGEVIVGVNMSDALQMLGVSHPGLLPINSYRVEVGKEYLADQPAQACVVVVRERDRSPPIQVRDPPAHVAQPNDVLCTKCNRDAAAQMLLTCGHVVCNACADATLRKRFCPRCDARVVATRKVFL